MQHCHVSYNPIKLFIDWRGKFYKNIYVECSGAIMILTSVPIWSVPHVLSVILTCVHIFFLRTNFQESVISHVWINEDIEEMQEL